MTDVQMACPDWLDEAASEEWLRWINSGLIGLHDRETLAVYSFVFSLRQRVRTVGENLRHAPADDTVAYERRAHLTVVSAIEKRLTSDLHGLSTALGISTELGERGRQTRILVLDEGAFDGTE